MERANRISGVYFCLKVRRRSLNPSAEMPKGLWWKRLLNLLHQDCSVVCLLNPILTLPTRLPHATLTWTKPLIYLTSIWPSVTTGIISDCFLSLSSKSPPCFPCQRLKRVCRVGVYCSYMRRRRVNQSLWLKRNMLISVLDGIASNSVQLKRSVPPIKQKEAPGTEQ